MQYQTNSKTVNMRIFQDITICFILFFMSNHSSAEVEILNFFGDITVETGKNIMLMMKGVKL